MDPIWIIIIVVAVLLVVLALVLVPRARRKERERKQLQAREHLQEANRISAQAEADRAAAEEQAAQARRERAEAELRAVEGERDAQQRLAEAERRQGEAQSLQDKAGRLDPRLRHDPTDHGPSTHSVDGRSGDATLDRDRDGVPDTDRGDTGRDRGLDDRTGDVDGPGPDGTERPRRADPGEPRQG